MANCPSLLLVKQMNCIVTLVRSRRLRYYSRGLRQFTVSLSVLAHPQMPVALRDPFRGGEDIFASSRLETTKCRQTDRTAESAGRGDANGFVPRRARFAEATCSRGKLESFWKSTRE